MADVWRENILIVDDNDMVRDLLKSLLNPEGNIDLACNGLEALKLMGEKEYKLVVSDVDMPVMDGLTFYGQVINKFPDLKDRFLFVSGNTAPERVAFFKKYNLNFMAKPMSVKLFRKKAVEILLSKDCCLLCK
jgi:CheY-like chemotaxis protein